MNYYAYKQVISVISQVLWPTKCVKLHLWKPTISKLSRVACSTITLGWLGLLRSTLCMCYAFLASVKHSTENPGNDRMQSYDFTF